jgi:hypothetical protein
MRMRYYTTVGTVAGWLENYIPTWYGPLLTASASAGITLANVVLGTRAVYAMCSILPKAICTGVRHRDATGRWHMD